MGPADVQRMQALASDDHEARFWLRHARNGIWLSVATIASGFAYALASLSAPRRPLLMILLLAALGMTAFIASLPLQRIVRHRYGLIVFYAWTGAICVFIGMGAWVDGPNSLMILLLFLPVVYGAMAYPPTGVALVGCMTVGTAIIVAWVSGGTDPARMIPFVAALMLATGMCASTAKQHWALYNGARDLAAQLSDLAHHDGLTGCLNHRAFHERLAAEVDQARRLGRPLSLLIIDLDDFKTVNDQDGHPAGDMLLRNVGAALLSTARSSDAVGRIGGDEFAVLLHAAGPQAALATAERIRTVIGELGGHRRQTMSIGVATLPSTGGTAATLVDQADRAAYAAKRAGRDRVCAATDRSGVPDRPLRHVG